MNLVLLKYYSCKLDCDLGWQDEFPLLISNEIADSQGCFFESLKHCFSIRAFM